MRLVGCRYAGIADLQTRDPFLDGQLNHVSESLTRHRSRNLITNEIVQQSPPQLSTVPIGTAHRFANDCLGIASHQTIRQLASGRVSGPNGQCRDEFSGGRQALAGLTYHHLQSSFAVYLVYTRLRLQSLRLLKSLILLATPAGFEPATP